MKYWEFLDLNEYFYCEHCAETFPAHLTKLVSAEANIKELAFHEPYTFVDEEGVIWHESGNKVTSTGDMVMSCPLCGRIQPKGFHKLIEVANT